MSSAGAVVATLEALSGTGIRWAVLHGEPCLAEGHTRSDIDLVVDRSPFVVFALLIKPLMNAGLHPIVVWQYDIGAATLFSLSSDLSARVQLDVMHDPEARGKYGLATSRLIESAEMGKRWPRLTERDTLLYEAAKRLVKRDAHRLSVLAGGVGPNELRHLRRRAMEVFPNRRRAEAVLASLDASRRESRHLVRQPASYWLRTYLRYMARLRTPAGFWVHLDGAPDHAAKDLHSQLHGALPMVRLVQFSSRSALEQAFVWVKEVAPVRWRPGLVISSGRLSLAVRPDVTIVGEGCVARTVVTKLVRRTLRSVSGSQRVHEVQRERHEA